MNKDICPLHEGMENKIEEIREDVKDIKRIILGNGNKGIMSRLDKLEMFNLSISSVFFRILNILEAILIAIITYKVIIK